jgi:hypothetical protein
MLVGGTGAVEVDDAAVARRLAESPVASADLRPIGLRSPAGLRALLALDARDLASIPGDAPLNTDDLPLLEFSAPLAMYDPDHLPENERLVRSARSAAPDARTDAERIEAGWVSGRSGTSRRRGTRSRT